LNFFGVGKVEDFWDDVIGAWEKIQEAICFFKLGENPHFYSPRLAFQNLWLQNYGQKIDDHLINPLGDPHLKLILVILHSNLKMNYISISSSDCLFFVDSIFVFMKKLKKQ